MLFRRNSVWWYDFSFRNQRVRESTHSRSKTVAREAEQQRRRDLERGIHNITEVQQNRIRALADIAEDYLADYRLRYRGVTFAEYAIGHVVRLLGDKLVVEIDDAAVLQYQTDRLKESAAPKSINEEVRFLLTLLGDFGELIRARLRKKKQLKLPARRKIGNAYPFDGQLRKIIVAIKMRSGNRAKDIREYEITSRGAVILGKRLANCQCLISGIPVRSDRTDSTEEPSLDMGIEHKN
jgi:hypothetical protein